MQDVLHEWMKETHDPLLAAFECRHSPQQRRSALIRLYGDNYVNAAKRRKKEPRMKRKKSKKTNR
jgi:hypothetical protein